MTVVSIVHLGQGDLCPRDRPKHPRRRGRSVVRLDCPGYNPGSFSPCCSWPRRTRISNNVSTRNANVSRRTRPTTWSSRRTYSGLIPKGRSFIR